jgi:hypothetical protein
LFLACAAARSPVDVAGEKVAVAHVLVVPRVASLGPSRGSGVLVKRPRGWKIAQYNPAIVIPNEKLDAVKAIVGP